MLLCFQELFKSYLMLLRRVIFRYRVCVKLDFALLGSGIVSRDWIFVVCVIKIKFCFILAGYGILELDMLFAVSRGIVVSS